MVPGGLSGGSGFGAPGIKMSARGNSNLSQWPFKGDQEPRSSISRVFTWAWRCFGWSRWWTSNFTRRFEPAGPTGRTRGSLFFHDSKRGQARWKSEDEAFPSAPQGTTLRAFWEDKNKKIFPESNKQATGEDLWHSKHQPTSSSAKMYSSVSSVASVATVAAWSYLLIVFIAQDLHYK